MSETPVSVAFVNQKGGVGKSTTTINVGAALAKRGHRVLVIDVDPQGTSTIATVGRVDGGTAEILGYGGGEDVTSFAERYVRHSEPYGFSVVGADFDRLNHQEVALTSAPMLMVRFAEFIETLAGRYDLVLFDCPPALRSLTTAAMYAADHVLLVVEPSKESLDGLGKLLSYLAGLTRLLKREPSIVGACVTKADPRERFVQTITEVLAENARVPWVLPIYATVGFKDAYSAGVPLAQIAKASAQLRAVDDISALAARLAMLIPVAA